MKIQDANRSPSTVVEASWPPDQDGWMFLGRALDMFGRAKFKNGWTGREQEPYARGLSLPAYEESKIPRWRSTRKQVHYLLLANFAEAYQIALGDDISKDWWDVALEIEEHNNGLERCRVGRFSAASEALRACFASGRIRTSTCDPKVGTAIELPIDAWKNNISTIFGSKSISVTGRKVTERHWIYVNSSDLRREIASCFSGAKEITLLGAVTIRGLAGDVSSAPAKKGRPPYPRKPIVDEAKRLQAQQITFPSCQSLGDHLAAWSTKNANQSMGSPTGKTVASWPAIKKIYEEMLKQTNAVGTASEN